MSKRKGRFDGSEDEEDVRMEEEEQDDDGNGGWEETKRNGPETARGHGKRKSTASSSSSSSGGHGPARRKRRSDESSNGGYTSPEAKGTGQGEEASEDEEEEEAGRRLEETVQRMTQAALHEEEGEEDDDDDEDEDDEDQEDEDEGAEEEEEDGDFGDDELNQAMSGTKVKMRKRLTVNGKVAQFSFNGYIMYSLCLSGCQPVTLSSCASTGKTPEVGIIVKIYCENFMCHRKLSVDLCANVNFINGENGSGKSAILAALQICLGARATVTHRARKIADLVRQGHDGYVRTFVLPSLSLQGVVSLPLSVPMEEHCSHGWRDGLGVCCWAGRRLFVSR